jgi:hypothetical protein
MIEYPAGASIDDQLRFLLRYAVLAPSTHNTQPWRFRVGGGAVELWADPARALPRIDPHRRQLHMSCGAALFHLRLGLRRFGAVDVVEVLPEPRHPELLARVRPGTSIRPGARELALFAAIPERRTNRAAFEHRPVAAELGEQLIREAAAEGAWLERLHPHDKLELAYLIADGDHAQLGDPVFRRELARWLVPRGSRRCDGIPMARKDVPTALPVAGPLLVRTFDRGDGVAAREHELATCSPMLAVLGTDLDEPRDWLAAGEAMEACLLRATHLGLAASFLNQAIEEPALRPRIATASHHRGFPQLVLRFGYGPPVAPTRRRPLAEVVLSP